MAKTNSIVTTIVFIGLIAGFSIASILKPDRNFSENENRYLTQKPEFSGEGLFDGTYTADYEEYITDQFVYRDGFISLKTVCERFAGKKDINGVYFAQDDYLIEAHPDSEIDEKLAFANADRMIAFVNEAAGMEGIRQVCLMIVPTAVITLKDKLPAFATTWDQNGFIDYMAEGVGQYFVDVREVLCEHADEYIYYKTDHHWTTKGAYLAYTKWAQQAGINALSEEDFEIRTVSEVFLGTIYSKINYAACKDTITAYVPKEEPVCEVTYNMGQETEFTLYNEEALSTKDKYSYFLNGNNAVVDIKTNAENGRKLLIIKDSYAHCFAPFTVNHYEEVVMIDLRYLKKPVKSIMEEYGITDILVLYNAIHFAQDTNMSLLQ
jgi:hypothetical protein